MWLGAALSAAGMDAVEIIAHRGASFDAPENTLPAVRLAWEQDADAVEVDVFLSSDGRVVVSHDDNTKRVAGVNRKIGEQTLAELQALDAGAWKDARWAGTRIPTLEQVLRTVPEGKRLVVEIKDGPQILPELERVLAASGKRSQTLLIGFSYELISAAKRRLPDLECYWLYGFSVSDRARDGAAPWPLLIEKARAAGLEGLDVNYKGPLTKAAVDPIRAAGMKLYVYTLDDAEAARRMDEIGVAGVTTNRPQFLRRALE